MSGSIVPTPAYTDVRKAVGFLVDAFGFERHTVYEDDAGNLAHVELVLGTSMVMPAVPGRGEYGDLLTSVADAGRPTGGAYVIVDDPYAHADRARAAGAEILLEPRERDYGGADYTCRDLEGHIWTFGSYDPWSTTGG
jgi:uncharacterized glyoxalase superfamily protein PhnB